MSTHLGQVMRSFCHLPLPIALLLNAIPLA
jgi:hypothetical protein